MTIGPSAEEERVSLLLEKLFGFRAQRTVRVTLDPQQVEPPDAEAPAAGDDEAANGIRVEISSRYEEHERSSFAVEGDLRMADGEELTIDFSLTMERSFVSEERVVLSAGAPIDPLVLDLDGGGVQLGAEDSAFDLDADGHREHVATLSTGDAFLALDRNGNGRIDDGTELFGPRSGDGIAELARYDEDGNGAIDAGDAISAELRLLRIDADGTQQLRSLENADVGAIVLQHTDTPFTITDAHNRARAQVRRTGIYLDQDHRAKAVQQIDLLA